MISLKDLDYELPEHLVAQEPALRRDESQALFVERGSESIERGTFKELPARLRGDECLVVNNTRVIPARIRAQRQSGGALEVFLLRPESDGVWCAWVSPAKRIRPPETVYHDQVPLEILERVDSFFRVRVGDLERVEEIGEIPLPPYIQRDATDARLLASDRERYQTVFASQPGAVAAPTAGLHFSEQLLADLEQRGIPVVPVTLHVGPGTFKPVTADRLEDHRVDAELYQVSADSRLKLSQAHNEGRRIVAVGTTSLRVLESLESLDEGPTLESETRLTIVPGHRFRWVQGLITNFHLPRTSLLALVATFHGLEPTQAAYRFAVEAGLRFYSYGDAMVILPTGDMGC